MAEIERNERVRHLCEEFGIPCAEGKAVVNKEDKEKRKDSLFTYPDFIALLPKEEGDEDNRIPVETVLDFLQRYNDEEDVDGTMVLYEIITRRLRDDLRNSAASGLKGSTAGKISRKTIKGLNKALEDPANADLLAEFEALKAKYKITD